MCWESGPILAYQATGRLLRESGIQTDVELEYIRKKNYEMRLETTSNLAFDSGCTDRNESVTGYPQSKDTSTTIAVFTFGTGDGTLTATKLVVDSEVILEEDEGTQPGNITFEATMTINPKPTPTPIPKAELWNLSRKSNGSYVIAREHEGATSGVVESYSNEVHILAVSYIYTGIGGDNKVIKPKVDLAFRRIFTYEFSPARHLSELAWAGCIFGITRHATGEYLPSNSSLSGGISVTVGAKSASFERITICKDNEQDKGTKHCILYTDNVDFTLLDNMYAEIDTVYEVRLRGSHQFPSSGLIFPTLASDEINP